MTKQQMVFLFLKLSKPMFRLTIARNKEHDKMKLTQTTHTNRLPFFLCSLLIAILLLTSACSAKTPNETAVPEEPTDVPAEETQPEAKPLPEESVNLPAEELQKDTDSAVDDSYFDDAVFIGDSLTEGFQMHGGITNATYYGYKNLNVKDVFEKPLVSGSSGKITVADALRNQSYGKYYILLGANELGWVYPQVFLEKYCDLIALIRQTNPNAVIYLQSVFPVSQDTSDTNPYYSNSRIDEYDQLIRDLAEDEQVIFLNVREAVENEDGILPDDAATDGVHLNQTYCEKWADYLRAHTEEMPS